MPVAHHAIFPNAGEALPSQIKHNVRGHPGRTCSASGTRAGVWYYFPVALTIKLPLPCSCCSRPAAGVRPRALFAPSGWLALVLCCSA